MHEITISKNIPREKVTFEEICTLKGIEKNYVSEVGVNLKIQE